MTQYLENLKQKACQLLNITGDDVFLTLGDGMTGTLGVHMSSYFYKNNQFIAFITINPILLQEKYKSLLFFVVVHELNHHKNQDKQWLIGQKYESHGVHFKKEFKKIGVNVDNDGHMLDYNPKGKFYRAYLRFAKIPLPFTCNTDEKIHNTKNVSIVAQAICPKCKLEVITSGNCELICKKCNIELDNSYNKRLLNELKERQEVFDKAIKDFEYLCFYHPIKKIQNNQLIKEALSEIDNKKVFDAIYDGEITKKGEKDLLIGANNLIVAKKNIKKIEEILNGK